MAEAYYYKKKNFQAPTTLIDTTPAPSPLRPLHLYPSQCPLETLANAAAMAEKLEVPQGGLTLAKLNGYMSPAFLAGGLAN